MPFLCSWSDTEAVDATPQCQSDSVAWDDDPGRLGFRDVLMMDGAPLWPDVPPDSFC